MRAKPASTSIVCTTRRSTSEFTFNPVSGTTFGGSLQSVGKPCHADLTMCRCLYHTSSVILGSRRGLFELTDRSRYGQSHPRNWLLVEGLQLCPTQGI